MSATVETLSEDDDGGLKVFDVALVPDDPPQGLYYRHRPDIWHSARELMRRWDVMFTLAERDIRAQYKQAVLGVAWALIVPLVSLFMLTILGKHVKGFNLAKGVPFVLSMYVGLLAWGFFGGSIGGGTNSLVANKSLMAKSHFPRECFPLSQVLESAFSSLLAVVPLGILFGIYHFAPKAATVWAPLYLLVELPITLGLVFFVSSVIVTMRDLQQIIPIFMPLIMLVTVLEPLSVYSGGTLHEHFVHGWLRPLWCVVNPMAPVISNFRNSILLGFGPQWGLLALAAIGSVGYLIVGYTVFKRLEVNFADLT